MNSFRVSQSYTPDTIRSVASQIIARYLNPTAATSAAGISDTGVIDLPSNMRQQINTDFTDPEKFSAYGFACPSITAIILSHVLPRWKTETDLRVWCVW